MNFKTPFQPALIVCPNCGISTESTCTSVRVTKQLLDARLAYCNNCDYLFLDDPSWLRQAYELGFYGDTGYIQRNLLISKKLCILFAIDQALSGSSLPQSACDVGSGLGMLPRLMRDFGYSFYGTDMYSDLALIQPFTSPPVDVPVITAFEVIEHTHSLPQFLNAHITDSTMAFIFSTCLRYPCSIPESDWWYYAFEIGQHIAFHSYHSIRHALARVGLNPLAFQPLGSDLYLLAFDKRWQRVGQVFKLLARLKLLNILGPCLTRLCNKPSLTLPDHIHALSLLRE